MKKLIGWELKKLLVPFFIFLGVLSLTSVITAATESLVGFVLDGTIHADAPSLFVTQLSLAAIVSFIFPLFVFNYKFGIRRADFYKQLPFAPKQFRRTMFTLGFLMLITTVTFVFSLSIVIYAIRYFTFDVSTLQENQVFLSFNGAYIFYFYLLLILTCFVTYSIACLFVHHNVSIFESIITVIAAEIVMNLLIFAISKQIYIFSSYNISSYYSFGIVASFMSGLYLNYQMIGVESYLGNISTILNLVFSAICGIGAFIYLMFAKDRSADKENEKGRPTILTLISIHGALFTLLIFFNTLSVISYFSTGVIVYDAFILVIFFFIQILYRHNFKLRLSQWIPFASIALFGIIDFILIQSLI